MSSVRFNTQPERIILVLIGKRDDVYSTRELSELVKSAGGIPVGFFYQNVIKPDAKTYIGSGKALDIKEAVKSKNASAVIIDAELSPAQAVQLEKIFGVKVLDRTELIMDIFATNARTHEARLQVELAQLKYLLPRLKRHWTHLSRQYGGMGTRGPGETQLEVDRRHIRKKITKLEKQLKLISKQRKLRSKKRKDVHKVSIVGYTNAGKSTLLNRLCSSNVLVENKMFSTLDSTSRRRYFGSLSKPVVFSDTVGLIRKLPHQLVAAFRSTLEIIVEADLLLVLLDATNPELELDLETVENLLEEIRVEQKPRILVLNKIDLLDNINTFICSRKNVKYYQGEDVYISAKNGKGINILLKRIENLLTGLEKK